jgi:hypothetical protein
VPLTLVLGPANSAKAGEVLGAYAPAARERGLLVVPTAADARHYARELARRGVVIGATVTTFTGLAREIAAATGFGAEVLSPVQREALVRRAVAAGGLDVLAPSARAAGFVHAAGAMIAELERSLVTPQRFAQAMGVWAGSDPARRRYGGEVASIYLGYAHELDRRRLLDADLFLWRALDALRAAPGAWDSRPVFVYGFDDLHPLQRDAVETLSRVARAPVTVSLTSEAGRHAFAARAEAVAELRALADTVIELPASEEHYAPDSRAALSGLERQLFEAGSETSRVPAGNAIRLLEAGGERAETELVAAAVLEELRAGVPAGGIAIIHRSPRRIWLLLERVLGGCGVRLAGRQQVAFAHTTLGRGLLALARCSLTEDADPGELLTWLRTPGMTRSPEVLDRLELELRRELVRSVPEARARLGWALREIDAIGAAADPGAELVRQARRLLALPVRGSAPLLDGDARLDARALATLIDALDDLAAVGERPDGGELVELLESLTVEAPPSAGGDAVLLADPLAVRARRFEVVVVCGLQEGEFPLAAAGDPFLDDDLRRELARVSGLRLRPRENQLEHERYLFYACVARPTGRLYLSYRSADEEGNLALPSPFIADVADVLEPGWIEGRRQRLLADVTWPPEQAPTARELERALAVAARDRRQQTRPEAPPVHRLGEAALAVARHRQVVSPGALECFADCPVKWLVEKELQPSPFGPDPYPLVRGAYLHVALEQVFSRLGEAVREETLGRAQQILSEVLDELPAPAALGRSEGVRQAALRSIEADLRRYLRSEARNGCSWPPAWLELRFGFENGSEGEDRPDGGLGDGGSLPALELGEGDRRVRLRGVIDRVDRDPDGDRAVVRDYKSSASASHPGARWTLDSRIQVALYMLVVRELLGLRPVAGLYQPLGGRDPRPRGIHLAGTPPLGATADNDLRDEDELDATLREAAELAVELAASLRTGLLRPTPETCSRAGCAYPAICRAG